MRSPVCCRTPLGLLVALLLHANTSPATQEPVPIIPTSPANSPTGQLDYVIVVTGGELLRGIYPDSHTHFITRTLQPIGGRCLASLCVDDHPDDLKRALQFASASAQLIIVTGGLGPTANDITRESLAEFTGITLQEHPQVLAEMERRFGQPRDQLRSNLRRQTRVPTRGTYLPNPHGTAVGLVFDAGRTLLVALPGPPRELQPMVTQQLLPFLRHQYGLRLLDCTRTLRFVGAGQSLIDQTIRDHLSLPPDLAISSLFEGGRVDFTFALPEDNPENRARLKQLGDQLRLHLEPYFYADDGSSLEDQILRMLQTNAASIVLVEVGSAGQLVSSLLAAHPPTNSIGTTFVAPSASALRPVLRVTDEQWARWQPGQERLQRLGTAAAELTRTDWIVVVGEVESGNSTPPQVCVAFGHLPARWQFQRLELRGTGEIARSYLVTQILDQLRRFLQPRPTHPTP